MSDSLQPHESQHARPPCPSPTPRVYSNSYPSSRWCHLATQVGTKSREEAGTQEDCSVYDNFRLLMSADWQNNDCTYLVLFKNQTRDLQIICRVEKLLSMPQDRKKFNRNWNWFFLSLKGVSQSSSQLNMWVGMISLKAHVRQKNWPKYNEYFMPKDS